MCFTTLYSYMYLLITEGKDCWKQKEEVCALQDEDVLSQPPVDGTSLKDRTWSHDNESTKNEDYGT